MIGKIAPHLFTPTSQDPKKEFAKLLGSRNDPKITQFIAQNPQLIHQPLSSGYTPIEHAIALRNPQSIRALIERGAKVNAANAQGISPFDQLILMKDYALLSQIFSPYFSDQIEEADLELRKYTQDPHFKNEVQRQIKAIYIQALRLSQNFDVLLDMKLKKHIEENNLEGLRTSFEAAFNQNKHHEIFSAVIYGIMNHKNQVIKVAHELIQEDLLTFKTTDLFNLYHIATLFNNADAIRLLGKLGLTKYLEKNNTTNSFSPYYFAIISPELQTFEALVDSKLPLPASANIKANFATASKNTTQLSPLQLWIAKAHLVDPMPKITFLEKLKTVSAVAYFAMDYFSTVQSGLLKDFFSLSYLFLQTTNNLSLLDEKQSWMISLLLSGISLYLQQSKVWPKVFGANALEYLAQILKFISVVSIVQKLKEELKIYSKTFYYRPLQTLKSFSFKLINHSLNLAFILQYFESSSAPIKQPNQQPKNESPLHDSILDDKIKKFSERLAVLSKEDTRNKIITCYGKYNSLNETQATLPINYQDTLNCLDYQLSTPITGNEVHRAFRALSLYVHPDRCPLEECSIISKAISRLANKIKTNNWP